ncbi:MAG TPA: hypothetical protein VKZ18_21785 [Polyangia bacterium]|nr:hypothetical protein [Polyangia bacterium]
MSTAPAETCATCYGQGEVVTDQGPLTCRDCMGHGKLAGRIELFEWRLREIERGHRGSGHDCEEDVNWLTAEVRRSRDALLQIFARCQDAAESDALAAEVRHLANGSLGLYPVESDPKS